MILCQNGGKATILEIYIENRDCENRIFHIIHYHQDKIGGKMKKKIQDNKYNFIAMKKIAVINLFLYFPACLAMGITYIHSQEDVLTKMLIQLVLGCAITSGSYLALVILKMQNKS